MPNLDSQIRIWIREADFYKIFNQLGWDNPTTGEFTVNVDGEEYRIKPVVQKHDMHVLECSANEQGQIPTYSVRQKIDRKITPQSREHIIIFVDTERNQVWQWAKREQGKVTYRLLSYYPDRYNEELIQRIAKAEFDIKEENGLTITTVTERVEQAFDVERITRKFYELFKVRHTKFAKQIENIDDDEERELYALLMLIRLMFIYFMQDRGFLDDKRNYLFDKLSEVQRIETAQNSRSQNFYQGFLRSLFHELNHPHSNKPSNTLIGRVPYLNGGLFDLHRIELQYEDINIRDEAFEEVFKFFSSWNWQLDDRPAHDDSEVNPDVMGYIFEKYVNQKQMGAYYTKEDITNYIAQSTIIPHLFDATQTFASGEFVADAAMWQLLRDDPDRYINAALSNVSILPNEGTNEHSERIAHYIHLREQLVEGRVHSISNLITLNLDLRRFIEDVIRTTDSTTLVQEFYYAIVGRIPESDSDVYRPGISVLDPTCGSGAFLFAALNTLEPIQAACLDRMEGFIEDAERADPLSGQNKHTKFRSILEQVKGHGNRKYFIYKSIIINNLFGVDIMPEAIEIAKLRLFLKLAAQVKYNPSLTNMGLEPLPDIDFNIKSGNTLIGFVDHNEVQKAIRTGVYTNMMPSRDNLQNRMIITEQGEVYDQREEAKQSLLEIEELAAHTATLYNQFRKQQTQSSGQAKIVDKNQLRTSLLELAMKLDYYRAITNGIYPKDKSKFDAWRKSHQPFHWYTEFYGIISEGGFDVIIGNPPYVEYSQIKKEYTIHDYKTEVCGNLYAYVIERCSKLISKSGKLGVITPLSLTSIREYEPLRKLLRESFSQIWTTNHAIRPVSLFNGISQRVSILIANRTPTFVPRLFSTNYLRTTPALSQLFGRIRFAEIDQISGIDGIKPKLSSDIEKRIWAKLMRQEVAQDLFTTNGRYSIHFKDYGETYWIFPLSFVPYLTPVKSYKELFVSDEGSRNCAVAFFNSSLFYWFYTAISDCWHFGKWHMSNFPLGLNTLEDTARTELLRLHSLLMASYQANRIRRYDARVGGELFEYKIYMSKPIIDEIDKVLAIHYGLTTEEQEHIINYDIKYRLAGGD